MARRPRVVVPGQAMHVVQRGNNRQAVFFSEEDYRYYLDSLEEMSDKYGCSVHAYVLMTNHVHLLMTPEEENSLSLCMQGLGRKYVRYINGIYQRTGTLWEGRYKSSIIDSEQYLLTCYRYIEMNPVRACMVDVPADYKWSSYHYNGLGKADALIKEHKEYTKLGKTKEIRMHQYRQLFHNVIDKKDIDLIRAATTNTGYIGNDRFKDEIEKHTGIKLSRQQHGGDRKSNHYKLLSI